MINRNINYFLDIEKAYNLTPVPDMIYIDGIGFEFPEEPLHFLRRKPFETLSATAIKANGKNGLCDVEWLMLYCFLGPFSGYFRSDNYHTGVPEVVKEMQEVLDSVISKAPKCECKTLYRFLNDFDKRNLHIGEVYIPTHSLTTTTEDWGKDSDMYIIAPVSNGNTRAHSLFKLYNHGDETQVNFERGTKFKVVDIKDINNRKIIFLNEIES